MPSIEGETDPERAASTSDALSAWQLEHADAFSAIEQGAIENTLMPNTQAYINTEYFKINQAVIYGDIRDRLRRFLKAPLNANKPSQAKGLGHLVKGLAFKKMVAGACNPLFLLFNAFDIANQENPRCINTLAPPLG